MPIWMFRVFELKKIVHCIGAESDISYYSFLRQFAIDVLHGKQQSLNTSCVIHGQRLLTKKMKKSRMIKRFLSTRNRADLSFLKHYRNNLNSELRKAKMLIKSNCFTVTGAKAQSFFGRFQTRISRDGVSTSQLQTMTGFTLTDDAYEAARGDDC